MAMKQILSIQSAVTYGCVGNSVAAPVITRLGMQPLSVDTIALAAHPGYGINAGGSLDHADFTDILQSLNTLNILPKIGSIVTGYLGSAEQVAPIEAIIKSWRAARPDGRYILDPVLGDSGRLYVDTAIVATMQQQLLPLAHIVTPNQFELSLLTDMPVTDVADATQAGRKMLQQTPLLEAVIATGIANTEQGISDLKISRHDLAERRHAKRPHGVAGGGDLLTAILSCWVTAGHDLDRAFAFASDDAHSIIERSATAIDIELFDNLPLLTDCNY
jgi:pyridoxine kinase